MTSQTTRNSTETSAARPGRGSALVAAMAIAVASLAAGGCNNAGEGALSGAAIGALAGLGIGSLTGSAGAGAAIGAIAGGVGGAVLGDQNERRERHSSGSDW